MIFHVIGAYGAIDDVMFLLRSKYNTPTDGQMWEIIIVEACKLDVVIGTFLVFCFLSFVSPAFYLFFLLLLPSIWIFFLSILLSCPLLFYFHYYTLLFALLLTHLCRLTINWLDNLLTVHTYTQSHILFHRHFLSLAQTHYLPHIQNQWQEKNTIIACWSTAL